MYSHRMGEYLNRLCWKLKPTTLGKSSFHLRHWVMLLYWQFETETVNLLPRHLFGIFLNQSCLTSSAANQDLAASLLLWFREQGLVLLEVCESQTLAVLLNHLKFDRGAVPSVFLSNRFTTPIESPLNFASVRRDPGYPQKLSPLHFFIIPVGGIWLGEGHLVWVCWIEQYENVLSSLHIAVSPC